MLRAFIFLLACVFFHLINSPVFASRAGSGLGTLTDLPRAERRVLGRKKLVVGASPKDPRLQGLRTTAGDDTAGEAFLVFGSKAKKGSGGESSGGMKLVAEASRTTEEMKGMTELREAVTSGRFKRRPQSAKPRRHSSLVPAEVLAAADTAGEGIPGATTPRRASSNARLEGSSRGQRDVATALEGVPRGGNGGEEFSGTAMGGVSSLRLVASGKGGTAQRPTSRRARHLPSLGGAAPKVTEGTVSEAAHSVLGKARFGAGWNGVGSLLASGVSPRGHSSSGRLRSLKRPPAGRGGHMKSGLRMPRE